MLPTGKSGLLAAFLAVGVLAACAPAAAPGGEKKAAPSGEVATGEIPKAGFYLSRWGKDIPKPGGVLQKGASLVAPSLDVIAEGTIGSHAASMPPYNSLLEYQYHPDDQMGFPSKIEPGLAERWEVSKDGLTYTFYLRKGVKFHDGVEFTSADAKFSIERVANPPPKTPSLGAAGTAGWWTRWRPRTSTPLSSG